MSGPFTQPDVVPNDQNKALKKRKLDSNPRYGPPYIWPTTAKNWKQIKTFSLVENPSKTKISNS